MRSAIKRDRRLQGARGLAMVPPVQDGASYFPLQEIPAQARVVVDVGGLDSLRFLQGLLSADVSAVAPGEARAAALLTVKGKIISEVIVLRRLDGGVRLAIPADTAGVVLADLERHVIMDDVTLAADPRLRAALVWPGGAGGEGIEAFSTTHPAPGALWVGDEEALASASAGLVRADSGAFEAHRLQAGAPAWRREIEDGCFPPEVGFVGAVSYEKGCFRGQEPLARIHARGQVNRVMVRVRAAAVPVGDAPVLLSSEGRPEAGRWTSWLPDGDGGAHGLAIVHRSVAVPGVRLQGGALAVEVMSGPIGDDAGTAGRHEAATVTLGRRG